MRMRRQSSSRPGSLKCASSSTKGAEQQSRAILFRARKRLVRQRTELINALRAALYEYGHVVPQGIGQIGRSGTLDPSTHLTGSDGKVRSDADMIFYNQLEDAAGCVRITASGAGQPG
jgi:stress response protein SCP2